MKTGNSTPSICHPEETDNRPSLGSFKQVNVIRGSVSARNTVLFKEVFDLILVCEIKKN